MELDIHKLSWVAWVLVIVGWFVSSLISKSNRKATEINKISDGIKSSLRELEDKALDFWIKNDETVYQFEFNIQIKRIYDDLKILRKLDNNFEVPNTEFSNMRKSITLNIESDSRPVTEYSDRARSISLSCYKLVEHLPRR